jgi:hypothetical protein
MRNSFLILLAVLSLASCKQTPTEPEDQSDPVVWTMPHAGAKFLMAIETTDSAWSVDRQSDADIFTVLEANVPWAGRNKTFRYGWGKTAATYHVTFEPNGDTGYESGFETVDIYPTGKVGRTSSPTEVNDSGPLHSKATGYRENLGREKITLGGVQYNAIKVIQHRVEVFTPAGSTQVASTTTTDMTWWFVTELGIAGKVTKDEVTVNEEGIRTHYTRSQTLSQILN